MAGTILRFMDVAILGASANPNRYAFKAASRLLASGHRAVGVNPTPFSLPGLDVVPSVAALPTGLHTLTVYLSSEKSLAMADAVVKYGFARVIFNPGAENPELAARLRSAGVEVLEACTLVMLATGQF
jgi:uncharacterized protein